MLDHASNRFESQPSAFRSGLLVLCSYSRLPLSHDPVHNHRHSYQEFHKAKPLVHLVYDVLRSTISPYFFHLSPSRIATISQHHSPRRFFFSTLSAIRWSPPSGLGRFGGSRAAPGSQPSCPAIFLVPGLRLLLQLNQT